MVTLIIFLLILWLPQAVYQYLLWSYWIQQKEYRFDRLRSFVYSEEGRNELKVSIVVLKFTILLGSILIPDLLYFFILILLLLDLFAFNKGLRKLFRRPVFTQRARKMTYVGVLSIFIVLYAFFVLNISTALLIGEFLLLIGPFLGVLITIPVVNKIKKDEVVKASRFLKRYNIKVIGITGSYGKTTTKEFLSKMLSTTYKVEKTKKNENTVFGIARKIQEIPEDTEFFVCEMGAYKKGEIKFLAEMTKPEIGMITGIEPQHLDLFGSIANIKKAKFELIEALPKDGTAVFNVSNEDTRELYRRAKANLIGLNIYGYILHSSIGKRYGEIAPDYESRIIESNEHGVKFEIIDGKSHRILTAPVTGIHFIENITGAILVARLLNVSWAKIEKALSELKMPERTMEVSSLGYGSLLIDDSNNTTPKGFLSALSYLSHFKNKNRVVITPGIIELGEKTHGVHKKLGSALENKSDYVIVTNKELGKYISSGYTRRKERIDIIEDPVKLLKAVEQLIKNESVILLEGVMSSMVYKYFMNRKK